MTLLLIIYLKTKTNMKKNWKTVLLYVVRLVELVISGAAGGAMANFEL